VAEAKELLEYFMDRAIAEFGLDSVAGKREVTGRILAMIKRVGDPVERNGYLQTLARRVNVEERVLTEALQRETVRRAPTRPTLATGPGDGSEGGLPLSGLEAELLGLLLRYPGLVDELPAGDLPVRDAAAAAVAVAWRERVTNAGGAQVAGAAELEAFVAELDPASAELARDLLARIATTGDGVQFDHDMARAALRTTLLRLREQRVEERIRSGRVLLEAAQRDGDSARLEEIERKLDELGRQKAEVTKAMREPAPLAGARRS
jgi:DNA primase